MKERVSYGKRIVASILAVMMLICMIPSIAFGAEVDAVHNDNSVHVIVENTTFTPDTADELGESWSDDFWYGTLVDAWVELEDDTTMMDCVVKALEQGGYEQTGAENNYISDINGLGEFHGGFMSGWMGTLNDWFTNQGFAAFSVDAGTLEAGDEIRIMYTTSYGEDLGGSWFNNSTELKNLSFSAGTLDKEFDSNTTNYVLTLPRDVKEIVVTPTAANKNFLVGTFKDGVQYKRTKAISVQEGDKIDVIVNYAGAPSMNSGAGSNEYSIEISYANSAPKVSADNTNSELYVGESLNIDLSKIFTDDDGDVLKYKASVNGEAPSDVNANYTFTADKEGVFVIEFVAKDDKAESGTYTATVNVSKAPQISDADSGKSGIDKALGDTTEYMLSKDYTPMVGSTGGEWMIIGLARYDKIPSTMIDGYYDNVVAYVSEKINDQEQLHRTKSTDNSRVILGLTAIGKDVTDVAGHNLLQGLTDMTYVKKQGINGPIWALIAFDSNNYEIPECSEGKIQVTREALIEYILEKQIETGGWALSGKTADPDMTAMAIQSLAPYYNSDENVKAAVDKALAVLSEMQNDDGGYASWGTVNSESIAQVLVALNSLGIDPANDDRFIKNGNTLTDAMLKFACDGGGFSHTLGAGLNGMATEQAYYALVSYDRLLNGETTLYDMTDIFKAPQMIEGNGATWKNDDKTDGLTFKSDAKIKEFIKVLVDDNEIDQSNYTLKEGSTVVTLAPEFLATLDEGNHTMSIVSKKGSANATFTVTKIAKAEEPVNENIEVVTPNDDTNTADTSAAIEKTEQTTNTIPKTGDNYDLALWLIIAIALGSGTVVTAKKRKDR